ncbi:MAG TPA: hypothetical protein VGK59_22410 [Ohtaekwangia sp.]
MSSLAQDTTSIREIDSLRHNAIQYTPYFSQDFRSSGNYARTIDDSVLFLLSSGVSVFNVLRGQVPGLVMSPYAGYASLSGFRTDYLHTVYDATTVMDGIPFSSSIGSYANLNSFEFASITAIGSADALNYINGGNYGAFLLRSKTGEGFSLPVFDFNSYTTMGIPDPKSGYPEHSWHLGNSIAYSQDFGKIDTRVSYNFQFQPGWGDDSDLKYPQYHNLKVNTGVVITDRLSVRIILDDRYGNLNVSEAQSGTQNFFTGNVSFKYDILDWLNITSQVAYSSTDSSAILKYQSYVDKNKTKTDRQLVNLFTNVKGGKDKYITWSGFAGIQFINQSRNVLRAVSTQDYQMESTSVSTGGTIGFRKFIHTTLLYKLNRFNSSINNFEKFTEPNYSVSTSFLLTELVKIKPFSIVKFRGSFSSGTSINYYNYPLETLEPRGLNKRNPFVVQVIEFGGDFFLEKPALEISINYFTAKEDYELPSDVFTTALDEMYRKGWEADIRWEPIRRGKFRYKVGIMLSTFNEKLIQDGNASDNVEYGPVSWRNQMFNQFKMNRIVFTALLDFVQADFGNGESSFVKLRDISLGYWIPFSDQFIRNAFVSVSGRNLYQIAGSGSDFETSFNAFEKNISLNISLRF